MSRRLLRSVWCLAIFAVGCSDTLKLPFGDAGGAITAEAQGGAGGTEELGGQGGAVVCGPIRSGQQTYTQGALVTALPFHAEQRCGGPDWATLPICGYRDWQCAGVEFICFVDPQGNVFAGGGNDCIPYVAPPGWQIERKAWIASGDDVGVGPCAALWSAWASNTTGGGPGPFPVCGAGPSPANGCKPTPSCATSLQLHGRRWDPNGHCVDATDTNLPICACQDAQGKAVQRACVIGGKGEAYALWVGDFWKYSMDAGFVIDTSLAACPGLAAAWEGAYPDLPPTCP